MPSIVYKKQKLIYCAMEKCAITRLIDFFGTSYDLPNNGIVPEQVFYPAETVHTSEVTIKQLRRLYPDYYIFTFIRNPFDRVVSLYCASVYSDPKYAPSAKRRKWGKIKGYVDFETFVTSTNPRYLNLEPFCNTLNDSVDFIGRFENIKNDFDKLCKILNISYTDHPLDKKRNVSHRRESKPYQEFYNSKTQAIISKYYSADLYRFHYEF